MKTAPRMIIFSVCMFPERTYPQHSLFRSGGTSNRARCGRAALFRVLAVYARFNGNVGYCQGMAACAGMLLMVLTGAEEVGEEGVGNEGVWKEEEGVGKEGVGKGVVNKVVVGKDNVRKYGIENMDRDVRKQDEEVNENGDFKGDGQQNEEEVGKEGNLIEEERVIEMKQGILDTDIKKHSEDMYQGREKNEVGEEGKEKQEIEVSMDRIGSKGKGEVEEERNMDEKMEEKKDGEGKRILEDRKLSAGTVVWMEKEMDMEKQDEGKTEKRKGDRNHKGIEEAVSMKLSYEQHDCVDINGNKVNIENGEQIGIEKSMKGNDFGLSGDVKSDDETNTDMTLNIEEPQEYKATKPKALDSAENSDVEKQCNGTTKGNKAAF